MIYILKQRAQHLLLGNNAPPHIRRLPLHLVDIRRLSETPQNVYLRTAHKQTALSDMGNSHIYFSLSYILHPSLLTVTVLLQLQMDY